MPICSKADMEQMMATENACSIIEIPTLVHRTASSSSDIHSDSEWGCCCWRANFETTMPPFLLLDGYHCAACLHRNPHIIGQAADEDPRKAIANNRWQASSTCPPSRFAACSYSHETEPSSCSSIKWIPRPATNCCSKACKLLRTGATLQRMQTAAGNNSSIVLLICSHHVCLPLQGVPAVHAQPKLQACPRCKQSFQTCCAWGEVTCRGGPLASLPCPQRSQCQSAALARP